MGLEKRDPIFVVAFSIITLGLYAIYWFYKTSKEMMQHTKSKDDSTIWTILLFIPIINFYALWKFCELFEKTVKRKRDMLLVFILWLVIFPVAQYVMQKDLNSIKRK